MNESIIDINTFGIRLSEVINEHPDFYEKTGIGIETIEDMKKDLSKVYVDDLLLISTQYQLSIDWLLGLSERKPLS